MPYTRIRVTGPQTGTVLVPSCTLGSQIVVSAVYIRSVMLNTVTLGDGVTYPLWETYLNPREYTDSDAIELGLFRCGENRPLLLTSTAQGELFVSISYHISVKNGT